MIVWRAINVSRGYPETMRELPEQQKIGLSGTEETECATEGRPQCCQQWLGSRQQGGKVKLTTFQYTENWRATPGESYTVRDSRKNARHCFLSRPSIVNSCWGTTVLVPEDTVVWSENWWGHNCREGLSVWTWTWERPLGCFILPSSQNGWEKDSHVKLPKVSRVGGLLLRDMVWLSQFQLLCQRLVSAWVTQDWKLTLVPFSMWADLYT